MTVKVHYENNPTICITINFDERTIKWFSNDQLVGQVPLSPQFQVDELYFLVGMRDADTAIELVEE